MLLAQATSDQLLTKLNDGLIKSWLESILPGIFGFIWAVILALIVYWVGVRIINGIRRAVQKSMKHHKVDEGVCTFTDSLVRLGLYIALFVVILNLFGVQTSSIAAAVAALGLTAGLSLQGSLSNFAGGVLILVLKPFEIGDYIIEDTAKNEGTVDKITIFYTYLRTVDNRMIVIPNGTLANTSLTNVTMSDKRQIDITISISYDADIRQAKDLLTQLIEGEAREIDPEKSTVFVRALGASSVDLGVRFWVKTEDYWPVYRKYLEDAKYALDENGISIPYNQLDVHINRIEEDN